MGCGKCCTDFVVDEDLLRNPAARSPVSQEFLLAHGVDAVPFEELDVEPTADARLLVRHRCQFLTTDGRCAIYATRPLICRLFICQSRTGADACTEGC